MQLGRRDVTCGGMKEHVRWDEGGPGDLGRSTILTTVRAFSSQIFIHSFIEALRGGPDSAKLLNLISVVYTLYEPHVFLFLFSSVVG